MWQRQDRLLQIQKLHMSISRRMRKNGMLHMKNLKHLFNNFQGGMSLWQNQD